MLNLRESLLSYQEYLEQLHKEKEALLKKVKQAFGMKFVESKQGGAGEGLEGAMKLEMDESLREIEMKF